MNHKIRKVRAKNCQLTCWFDDGSVMIYDMKPILKKRGPMLDPLKRKSFFELAFVESGSVIWPNGFDICPNLIYRDGEALSSKKAA